MSNAVVVNGSRTRSGHPIAVFGPQVSYFAPQILSQIEIQSPHYSAEGASFPGTGLVELGRGRDYAWSATSAGSDLVDVRVERLCRPGGGKPAPQQKSYLFRGRCLPMTHHRFSEFVQPKASGAGAPAMINHDIYWTRHGVVQGWTTVGKQPVAIVNQRSTYGHDIDSVIGFVQFGQPGYVHDVASWMRAASHIAFTFNWFYADSRDTGYYVSGRDPKRAPNVDTALPTWGTGGAEWRGLLGFAAHPHQVNPPQGYFVSWNNKPAQGWADDGDYAYGATYRSVMLENAIRAQLASHPGGVTRADVVKAMESAASQDLDGVTVMRRLLTWQGTRHEPPRIAQMLAILRAWVDSGSHRLKAAPNDSQYQHAAAVAISDELMVKLVRAMYDRNLASGGIGPVGSTGGASTTGYRKLPMQWVNTPNSGGAHLGSAYDGGYEGYLMTNLAQLMGHHPRDAWSGALWRNICQGGARTCHRAVDAALARTYDALVRANGTADPSAFTESTASHKAGQTMPQFDSIAFRALGIMKQPNIDWQNRPTFQQVVEFPRHR